MSALIETLEKIFELLKTQAKLIELNERLIDITLAISFALNALTACFVLIPIAALIQEFSPRELMMAWWAIVGYILVMGVLALFLGWKAARD